MARRDHDIKAPDGYLLGGERRVRRGGIILFQRGWYQLPANFAEQGEYCWVHSTDGGAGDLEVAPPGWRNFYGAAMEGKTVLCARTERADARPGYRIKAHKAYAEKMLALTTQGEME